MVALSLAVEALNGATSDLRAEVGYLENLSETNDGDVSPAKSPYDEHGNVVGRRFEHGPVATKGY